MKSPLFNFALLAGLGFGICLAGFGCGRDTSVSTSAICTLSPTYVSKASGVAPIATTTNFGGNSTTQAPGTISSTVLPSVSSTKSPSVQPTPGSKSPSILPAAGTTSVLLDNAASSYDRLSYQAIFASDCLALVSDRTGGFYYRINAAAEASVGYLESANFGGLRTETFSSGGADKFGFSAGATSIERQYQNLVTSTANSMQNKTQWLLPWESPPSNVTITFMLPTNSETKLYPTTVSITLKATDL